MNKHIPSQKKKKILVKNTSKYGGGVFADEDIKKGEIIHVLGGRRLDVNDIVEKINSGEEYEDDPLQIGKRTYIDLDNFSRMFNHSCDPNGSVRKRSELFAIKDIKKGEEITYDYSATIAPTEWKMPCKCESKNCRKILGDVTSISKEQLGRYWEVGSLQRYMRRLLRDVEKSGKYQIPKYETEALEKLKIKK